MGDLQKYLFYHKNDINKDIEYSTIVYVINLSYLTL